MNTRQPVTDIMEEPGKSSNAVSLEWGGSEEKLHEPKPIAELHRSVVVKRPQMQRVAIKTKGKIIFIDPAEIFAVLSERNYVSLLGNHCSYVLRESLCSVAKVLAEFGFIQIHRSTMVNMALVTEAHLKGNGEYRLFLKNGTEYTVSRTYRQNLTLVAARWIGDDRLTG